MNEFVMKDLKKFNKILVNLPEYKRVILEASFNRILPTKLQNLGSFQKHLCRITPKVTNSIILRNFKLRTKDFQTVIQSWAHLKSFYLHLWIIQSEPFVLNPKISYNLRDISIAWNFDDLKDEGISILEAIVSLLKAVPNSTLKDSLEMIKISYFYSFALK